MDRREIAEENYRQKFNDLGLSESFEFLRREWTQNPDRRFWCKCRTCGHEFIRYNDVLRGRQSRLICPQCGARSDGSAVWAWSGVCDEAMSYYAQGHSVAETAERFGVSKANINNAVKIRGITNGIDFRNAAGKSNKQRSHEAEMRCSELLASKGFAYIDGYVDKHSSLQIQCNVCGAVFARTVDYIKHGEITCPQCEHEKVLARQEEKKRIAKIEAETRAIEREWHRLTHPPKDYYDGVHEAFLNRTGVCEICGKPYTVREYVESCGLKRAGDNGVCSAECRKIKLKQEARKSHKDRQDSHRHRARKYGCEYDPSVKLPKLIERNGLRCAICGEMCDPNDHSWSKYSGPMYPSIDHIVPMSKGGGHTWDNVQVAHIICNSEKGDRLEAI